MALNEGFRIKEEPQDVIEGATDLSKLIPDVRVKLEEDALIQDKPELINLQSNSIDRFNGAVKEDILFEDISSVSAFNNQGLSQRITEHDEVQANENLGSSDEDQCSSDNSSDNNSLSDENDGEIMCKVCKQAFLDDFDLQLHYKSRRSGEKSYKCCGCEKVFRDNTQLNVHSRKHTGEQPYACTVCGKKFSVNGNLSKHMRIHTGERRYECDTCERKFTQFAHLEDHMKTHSGDRPYVCDFCNSAFKTKARLKKHRKSHEDDKVTKRSVPCPVCFKLLKSTKQLLAHMDTHDTDGGKPFSCNVCGKSYKNLFYLNFHLKAHGDKQFKCNLCDKAFYNASHLRRHINSHTGIRPYSCELCKRAFPSQQNLKRHMMTHTGEKPYSCQDCSKGFLTLENLNRHKRTHTGEKPFPCDICGKYFAHSTTAKEHMRIHTGDKPFSCNLCEKKFSLNKALYKHIRERHPAYFPEFKKMNDLPPNMKRAREKMKQETMTVIEENDVKHVTNQYGAGGSDIVTKRENIDGDIEEVANEIPFVKVEKQEFDYV